MHTLPPPEDDPQPEPYFARFDRLSRRLIEAAPGACDEHLPIAEAIVREARAELSGGPDAPEFVAFADLRAAAPPEPEWVWRDYLARGAVTLLAGKPKAGKSTLACALVEAIDADAPTFLGRRVCGGPVVYVSEEGAGTLAPKLPDSRRSRVLTRDAAFPKPAWADLIAAAVAEAERIDAALLVIDALSFWASFGEGQEKDAGSAQRAMDALGAATGAGLAVLIVHHQRKAGGEDGDAVRGSGAIFGAVDALAEIERPGDAAPPGQRRVFAVSRWPGTVPALVIDRDAGDGSWRVVGEAESRDDAAHLSYRDRLLQATPTGEKGATEPELADVLEVDPRKVAKPLRELLADGLIERYGGGKKGDPYRYRKLPRNAPPEPGENPASKFSPPPIGGEIRKEHSFLPTGEHGGETLEAAILDPVRAEQIRASVDGEWIA